MKKVLIKRGYRICSRCGRRIVKGEYAWLGIKRWKKGKYKRKWVCKECYEEMCVNNESKT